MSKIKSVVIDHSRPTHLRLGELDYPQPLPNQALVKVAAFSLNPGELGGAARRENGSQIGWDIAGTVVQTAADGSGPKEGSRVVGTIVTGGWANGALSIGGWAEVIAATTSYLAEIPDSVTFAQAATLPVAGLTALTGLEKNGSLWQKRVLVTAANGAVGDFGVQIARSMGAFVVGSVRNQERADSVRESGANEVVAGNITQAQQFGPYDMVLDSLGGPTLAEALNMLAPGGLAVTVGTTESSELTFSPVKMFQAGGVRLYPMALHYEFHHLPVSRDLARLAQAVAAGDLKPRIALEESWEKIEEVIPKITNRQFNGKVVLHL